MTKTKNIIKIKNLSVIYNKGKDNQVRALDNVDLELKPEEWVIIFGPSGCGKSTLLNSIAGLETPTSGRVSVLGREIYKLSSNEKAAYRGKLVGMIFQSFHLINSLKVIDNVCLPQVFFGQDLKQREEMAMIFLNRFGIGDQAQKYPSDISGGQRQRVSIARALMNRPEIILADEPVGNLDSKATYNVLAILKELNKVDKKTIIMVTHDRDHLKYADRVIHMKDGKIIKIEIVKKRIVIDEGSNKESVSFKEVRVPSDLKLLMKSFKDLSGTNISQLLVPFKVKQTFSHLMLPITNYQAELSQRYMKGFFLGNLTKKQLFDKLNKSLEEGGSGWDKRNAKKFTEEVVIFYNQSKRIDYSKSFKSAIELCRFFVKRYPVRKTEYEINLFRESIDRRLKSEISKDVFQEILNKSIDENGLGLNSRTAQKIARELELLILIRYSS